MKRILYILKSRTTSVATSRLLPFGLLLIVAIAVFAFFQLANTATSAQAPSVNSTPNLKKTSRFARILRHRFGLRGPYLKAEGEASSTTVTALFSPIPIDFPGATETVAARINDSGDVVGSYTTGNGLSHGFKLSGGNFTAINFPGALETSVAGINNAGVIVGAYVVGETAHGFRLSGSTFTTIDFLPNTVIYGINDADDIVGSYNFQHGFKRVGGIFTAIDFPGSFNTEATGINNAGEIVGYYSNLDDIAHGFRLSGSSFTPINAPSASDTVVEGINNAGDIVGEYYFTNDGFAHAFKLSGGSFTTIDFPCASDTVAGGINSTGVIVGGFQSNQPNGTAHGFRLPSLTPLTACDSSLDDDGDGLSNCWEANGIDGNNDGCIDLVLPDANPRHKDLYLEIDYMANTSHSHIPSQQAIDSVVAAFNAAPVSNPDNVNGIKLHTTLTDADAVTHSDIISFSNFDSLKNVWFGTATQRSNPNRMQILAAKRLAYRYAVFAHNQSNGSTGIASGAIWKYPTPYCGPR